VVHNAVDVRSFSPTGRRGGTADVIGVGRFAYPKDFMTLLEAVRLVEAPCHVRLAGDGPALSAVESAVLRDGLSQRVELLGARADVPDLLARSDVFVLSSRSEGFPVSVLEAMAAGLPVVATDVGGVAEAVEDGETGFLVPTADPEAFARALDRLLVDGELRRRMGAAGRARALSLFDVSGYRAAYGELYWRELRRSSPAASRRRLSASTEPGE
jgi:glycosyltransferase involved in cell wall biosynthesis